MAAGLVVGQLSVTRAATFAQFIQAGSSPGFALSGSSSSNTGTLSDINGTPLVFQFKSFAAGSLLNTNIDAVITLHATESDAGRQSGSSAQQDFNNVSWSIVATNSARNTALGISAGANLLSGTSGTTGFNGGTLSGSVGGDSATFNGSDVTSGSPLFFNTVSFSSDFINFANATNKAYAYSFTSVNPMYFLDGAFPDYFIRDFTANGTGTFSAINGPSNVPEPGTWAMFVGMGVSGGIFGLRRRRMRA
jgi:hypothetical protein